MIVLIIAIVIMIMIVIMIIDDCACDSHRDFHDCM